MKKIGLILFGLISLLSLTASAQSPIKVTNLDKSKLPPGIKYAGKLKNAIRWTTLIFSNRIYC